MADCFAADVDDLHRRWLPREIFADIGIADAAPPSAAAVVEDVAVHLTGKILGGKEKEAPPRPPPPPGSAPQQHHHHQYYQAAQVGGLQVQGAILVAYGGVVPAPWPFLPYPPLQWQFTTTNFGNGGGGFPGAAHSPSRPFHHGPPPEKRRLGGTGGTGVFLPRASQVYQYQHKAANRNRSPAEDGKPPKEYWRQQRGGDDEAAELTQQN